MKTLKFLLMVAALALVAGGATLAPSVAWAGDCGCEADCAPCKVCKLVRYEKEVIVTCYGCKYKDICLPGCGSGCTKTECVKAGECNCCDEGGVCKVKYASGKPCSCAKMRTVKELVKYEVTKIVPAYKWVVVDAAPCGCGCDATCGVE